MTHYVLGWTSLDEFDDQPTYLLPSEVKKLTGVSPEGIDQPDELKYNEPDETAEEKFMNMMKRRRDYG